MFKKMGLLALTVGVLATQVASAEENRGFYFGLRGGAGSVDLPSRRAFDSTIIPALPSDLTLAGQLATLRSTDGSSFNYSLASLGASSLDDSVKTWGAEIGYRFNNYFAVEGGYVNLGEASYRVPLTANSTVVTGATPPVTLTSVIPAQRAQILTSAGVTAAAVGIFPIGQYFEIQGRGGIYIADTRVTSQLRNVATGENLLHGRADASETELYAGIAGVWNINQSFSLRLEYQKYFDVGDDETTGESDIDVINLNVLFR